MNSAITIPASATMRRQTDGSYVMVDAEYITVTTDDIARILFNTFGLPTDKQAGELTPAEPEAQHGRIRAVR